MNKIVFVLIFLIKNVSFAQTSVTGFGIFKIGKTNLSVIDTVLKELNTEIIISYEMVHNYEVTLEYNKVYELKRDGLSPSKSDFHSTECKGFRVFYISTYEVSDILIEDIYLTFKDNILYDIQAKSKELYKALKIKYPKFKESRVDEKTNCVTGGLKDTRFDYDTEFKTKWSNGLVVAEIIENYYFNNDCQRRHYDYINIYKIPKIYLRGCDNKIQEAREIKAKKAMQDKLKDL